MSITEWWWRLILRYMMNLELQSVNSTMSCMFIHIAAM